MGNENGKKEALVFECVQMVEKYEYEMIKKGMDMFKCIEFNQADMKMWKEIYYKELVENGPIIDDLFFYPDGSHRNFGIGNDGKFQKIEYTQFLYQAYKYLTGSKDGLAYKCAAMLEKYVEKFHGKRGNDLKITYTLDGKDKSDWLDTYYPRFVRTNMILDDKFFTPDGSAPNVGIGSDAKFQPAELFNVLARLYKICALTDNKPIK